MASSHKHAPWRKAILIPFWVIQLLLEGTLIITSAVAIETLASWDENYDGNGVYSDVIYGEMDHQAVHNLTHVVAPTFIAVMSICLTLTITEIILLATYKLNPLIFVIMNTFKTTIWTAIFILDIISVYTKGGRTASPVTIIIDAWLLLCFWIPLIYGSVIYHRSRQQKITYKPVDHPYSTPYGPCPIQTDFATTEYPSQYKNFIQEKVVETEPQSATTPHSANTTRTRRLSYNHQRDTRFDAYRQSFPDVNLNGDKSRTFSAGSPIPQVHVEFHDGGAFENGNFRRVSR